MIIVMLYRDEDTGELLVDHGYEALTGRPVAMPQGVPPHEVGAYFAPDIGEYIIPEDEQI